MSLSLLYFDARNDYTLGKHADAILSDFSRLLNNNFQITNCDIFLIFALNINSGYNEAVLSSTHNLYLRAKIRKKVYPCKPQFYYIKVGCKGV